jgi:hypothetical protein
MHGSVTLRLLNISKTLLSVVALIAFFCLIPAQAQKKQGSDSSVPKYDLHSETSIKGTVDELKLPANAGAKDFAQLMVKNGAEIVDVYLCPKSFLDDMGVSFTKGNEVTVTGSQVKQAGTDIVLAREVVKGDDRLTLRDDKGVPVWNWQKN